MMTTENFTRSNRILIRKFMYYIIPTMVTTAAISLNEFVDSLLAASLLDNKAMAIINLGMPTAMLLAGIYTFLGNGAATFYATCLGSRDTTRAGQSFRAAMLLGLIAGVIVPVLGFMFFDEIAALLCRDESLLPAFIPYFRVQLYSAPLLVIVLTLSEFFAPCGVPSFASAVILTANVVNLIMDYVYMGVLNLGVQGAAWATFTGYVAGFLLTAYFFLSGRVHVYYAGGGFFGVLSEFGRIGASPALSQLSFAPRYAVTNALVFSLAGTAGIVAFSLCCQVLSIVSIFIMAVVATLLPIVAVLHGQKDYRGESGILSVALKAQFVMNLACVLSVEIFAEGFARLYSITDPHELAVSVKAVRIFSVMFLFRSTYLTIMKYWQASGKNTASFVVSMLDGFAGILPVIYVMSLVMGITGVWLGYVVNAVLILSGTVMYLRKSGRNAKHEDPVLDATIVLDNDAISGVSSRIEEICRSAGVEESAAMRSAVAAEEMAVYSKHHMKKNDYMDITARVYSDRTEIDFRTLGEAFNPMSETPEDMPENMKFLRSVSSSIEHDYIIGMNCTRITIARQEH